MLKKLFFTVGGIVIVLALAALAAPMFIDSNSFKHVVTKQLADSTGYNITIGGNMNIRMLPFAHLRAEDVTIANPQFEPEKPLAKMKVLDVGVGLLPLLRGEVDIRSVQLEEPALRFVKANGTHNWHVGKDKAPASVPAAKEAKPAPVASSPGIVLHALEIKNGALDYEDRDNRKSTHVRALNVDAGMGGFSSLLTIKADAVVNDKPVSFKAKLAALDALLASKPTPVDIAFESDAVSFSAKGETAQQKFKGRVAASSKSVASIGEWLNGVKPSSAAAIALDVQGNAACTTVKCDISDAVMTLGDTKLAGSLGVNVSGSLPAISANLATDHLNVTPYMAQEKASLGLISPAYADAARWSTERLDFTALQSFNADVNINAARFTARDFTMGKVTLKGRVADGRMTADIKSADMYKGTLDLLATVGSSYINLRANAQAVDVGAMLKALSGSDTLSGKGNVRTELSAQGNSQRDMVGNLNGNGSVKLEDGVIRGLDIAGMVRNVKASFMGGGQQKTEFSQASGTFTIEQGTVSNNDLVLTSGNMRVGGKGTVNLPAYTINYRLTPELQGAKKEGTAERASLGVPILVTGSLENPTYAPDVAGIITEVAKDPKAARQVIKDNLKDVKGLLKEGKQLFKGL